MKQRRFPRTIQSVNPHKGDELKAKLVKAMNQISTMVFFQKEGSTPNMCFSTYKLKND
jgi:hypothetical protein